MKKLLLILMLVSVVSGTNRYISTTGSDANDGTYEHPWATFSYALCGGTYGCGCVETNPNLVSSGDTLFVRGGYYDVSSEITNKYILIGNSGQKNAPLVIKAFHGETPIIDGKYANELFVLGMYEANNYIVFDSLFLMRGTRALIHLTNNYKCSNVTIKNCRLMGTYVANDYNAAIELENNWDSTYVYNNYITGDTIINRPSQAIELYTGGNNCKIFNNTIRYVTRGIYYKRGNIYPDGARKFYIANNYINDVVSHGIDICADSGVIINNLIVGARGAGIAIYGENSGGCDRVGAFHNQIINNTVVDCNLGIELGYTGGCPQKNARYTKVFRNVVRNNNHGVLRIWPYAPADSINRGGTTADSNVFYSTNGNYMYNWSTEYTLSTHKAASNINLNSLFGSIVFVDSAGGNFSLAATSTGYGFGAGVNMDSVGIIPESAQSSPVVISVQPRDTTVNDGSTATFTIAATNATGYQWYGNGALISGATSNTYSFTATLALNNSKIYCRVTNATDTVWSDTATLTVNALPKTPANITVEPVSDTVTAGQSATFFVAATGTDLTYQWYRNDSLISGATNDTFTYTSRSQVGNYTDNIYCLLTTDTTISTDTVQLLVNGIVFRQSTDTLKLVCSNNQNVKSWQWYKNNVTISGATDSVLSVVVDSTSVTKSVYYCEISNGTENKKVGDWTIERKANGRTVSRKNKYR